MAPIAVTSDTVSLGQHACGIVGSGSERLRMVSGFVRSGLAAGDRVWCFPNGRRSDVLDRLRHDDVGDDVLASGQLTVAPTHQSVLSALDTDPEGVIDGLRSAVDDALGAGWNGFRLLSDLGWATRGPACAQHLLDFEARVGDALAELPAATLCQYDRYRFDADTMLELTGAHAAVLGAVRVPIEDELTCAPLPGRPGLRLVGVVDLATREILTAALDTVLSGSGDLHLDLSQLTFIDHGGVRFLLQLAQRIGPDRHVVIHRPPRSLAIVQTLFPDVPNLVVAEEEPA